MERVCVFIDGSNLELSVRNSFQIQVLPEKLAYKLADKRQLVKVLYYEAPLLQAVNASSYSGQQLFFDRLKCDPHFEVRLGRRVERSRESKCPKCGEVCKSKTWEQKGVDSLLVLDLVTLATRNVYDTAVLVAGDEDFVPPCIEVRCLGKVVENAFTHFGWSPRLRAIADKSIELTKPYLTDCLKTN